MDKLMNARRCKDGVKVDERGNRDARDMGEDFVMVDSKDVDYVETLLEGEDDDVMYISRKEEEEVLKTGTVALEEQVASIENPVSVEDTATTVMQDNLLEGDNAIDAIVEDVLQGDDTTVTDTLLEEVGTALLEHDVLLNALRTDEGNNLLHCCSVCPVPTKLHYILIYYTLSRNQIESRPGSTDQV